MSDLSLSSIFGFSSSGNNSITSFIFFCKCSLSIFQFVATYVCVFLLLQFQVSSLTVWKLNFLSWHHLPCYVEWELLLWFSVSVATIIIIFFFYLLLFSFFFLVAWLFSHLPCTLLISYPAQLTIYVIWLRSPCMLATWHSFSKSYF